MAARRDHDALEPYSSSSREQWLHSLKLALRDKSKFAREMVEGIHTAGEDGEIEQSHAHGGPQLEFNRDWRGGVPIVL